MSLSDPNLIIEAALRNDARRGLPPRYKTADVLPLSGPRPTIQGKIETLIFQQSEARKAYFDAITDRDELIVRLSRRQLRDIDNAAVTCAQMTLADAEVKYAAINGLLLDAESDLDVILHDDMTDALIRKVRLATAPTGNGDDSAQHLGFADYGLSAERRA